MNARSIGCCGSPDQRFHTKYHAGRQQQREGQTARQDHGGAAPGRHAAAERVVFGRAPRALHREQQDRGQPEEREHGHPYRVRQLDRQAPTGLAASGEGNGPAVAARGEQQP